MDLAQVSGVGFVGLGAMGLPMAGHLATKLSPHIRIYVYDIVQESLDNLQQEYPERVAKGSSARDVAEKSVCRDRHSSSMLT